MNNRYCIILFGPTAVGKTDLSLALARKVSGEIINMDVGQLYTPLSIGTAKPIGWQESDVVHHMFDIVDQPVDYNAHAYRHAVTCLIEEVWQRKHVPIIVGGSGFYLASLLFEITAPHQDHQTLIDVETLYRPETDWWQTLYQIDPERARAINPHDLYRIKRALAIWHTYSVKPSTYATNYHPIAPMHIFFLERNRPDLYHRINQRIYQMMDEGWLTEVTQLKNTAWQNFLLRKKLIGYDDLLTYLQTEDFSALALDAVINTVQQKTRNYAKRQITFAKMIQKKLSFAQICGKLQYDTPITLHKVAVTNVSTDDCVTTITQALP